MKTDTAGAQAAVQVRGSYFHVWMAWSFVAVAFLGFTPTYFMPLLRGTFQMAPIVHIHASVFFLWTLLYAWQTWLVARGRTLRHREIGLLGISLATAMTLFGLMVGVAAVERMAALGFLQQGKAFLIVPVSGILTFAVLFTLAIANIKHKEVHKRLMLVASASLLDAPVARWFMVFLAPPPVPGAPPLPPVDAILAPALLIDLFIIAAMLHDWRTRGRVHPVYLLAGAGVLVQQLLRGPLSTTAAWDATAGWLLRVAG
jgi:hypothetical protein